VSQMAGDKKRRNLVISLIIIGVLSLLVLVGVVGGSFACCGGSALWGVSNSEGFIQALEEGYAYGSSSTQEQCVQEALTRIDACDDGFNGITCQTTVGSFMTGCMQRAAPTPGFCDGVPPQNDIFGQAKWQIQACTDVGRGGDKKCQTLMQSMARYCSGPSH
jgi:hypothetical protein